MSLYIKVVIASWAIFSLYWLVSAFGSKRNTNPQLNGFMGIRLAIFALAVLLFRFLNIQNQTFHNHLVSSNKLVLGTGLIILMLGLLLAVWARVYLGKNWGMPMSQKQDTELVTSGPYRYVRHPIYLGFLIAILGSALASSIFWLIIFAISGAYFIYSALMEEKHLTIQFPKVYPSYKTKTKMLVPFIF